MPPHNLDSSNYIVQCVTKCLDIKYILIFTIQSAIFFFTFPVIWNFFSWSCLHGVTSAIPSKWKFNFYKGSKFSLLALFLYKSTSYLLSQSFICFHVKSNYRLDSLDQHKRCIVCVYIPLLLALIKLHLHYINMELHDSFFWQRFYYKQDFIRPLLNVLQQH